MLRNLSIDFAIGLVPVVGDIVDTLYRCNTKNAQALEDLLIARVALAQKATQDVDKAGKVHRTPAHSHDDSETKPDLPPKYETASHSPVHDPAMDGQRPKPVRGWLASLKGRNTQDAGVVKAKDVAPSRPARPTDNRQQRNML